MKSRPTILFGMVCAIALSAAPAHATNINLHAAGCSVAGSGDDIAHDNIFHDSLFGVGVNGASVSGQPRWVNGRRAHRPG